MSQASVGGVPIAQRHYLIDRLFSSLTAPSVERICLLLLSLGQAAAVIFAGGAAKVLYLELALGQPHEFWQYLTLASVFAITLHCVYKRMGLQSIDALMNPTIDFGRVWGGLCIAFMGLLGGMYMLKITEDYSRGWFLAWFAISAVGVVVVRWSVRRVLHQLMAREVIKSRIAVLGTRDCVDALRRELEKSPLPYGVVDGFILSDVAEGTGDADQEVLRQLVAAMQNGVFAKVVIALPAVEKARIRQALRRLAPFAPEILMRTDLLSSPAPIHEAKLIGGVRVDVISPIPASEAYRLEKRLFDVVVAVIALVLLAPLFVVVALAIKLDSSGPVFFRQRRYGRNSRVFRIFKFRTMTVADDGDRIIQAQRDDLRVTRVGRFLRATSIDELPQILNVLLGQMSIVGPRPHALVHEDQFDDNFDLFSRRRRVLPGITGWAQVNGERGETRTLDDVERRMNYDLYYMDNWSIWFDLEIIARTFTTVLRGAY